MQPIKNGRISTPVAFVNWEQEVIKFARALTSLSVTEWNEPGGSGDLFLIGWIGEIYSG